MSAADQDWDGAAHEYLLRDAAQQDASESPAAMGGHDDQIAIALFSRIQDALCRVLPPNM